MAVTSSIVEVLGILLVAAALVALVGWWGLTLLAGVVLTLVGFVVGTPRGEE